MLVLHALTLFLAATLLFLVQPMFARLALPLFGGSPAVWTTAVLFYQAALLAGYAYAHAATRWLAPRRQAALHLSLLLLALGALPITAPAGWAPPPGADPAARLLGLLLVGVGPPFVVVSATSPLLQAWFARSGHPRAADPYPLAAASNAGSLLALLAYPTVVEPALSLSDQRRAWSAGYALLVAATGACAAAQWRAGGSGSAAPAAPPDERPTVARRARWVALAFVPSSLMLGVTSHLTTQIAPLPMLWVLPLALFLATFALAFGAAGFPHRAVRRATPIVLVPLVVLLAAKATAPLGLLVTLHLAGFCLVALGCHGALARDRPEAAHLTGFWLWISVGGALGGLFDAIVAPALFTDATEYPAALVLACLLLDPGDAAPATDPPGRVTGADLAHPAALGLLTAGLVLLARQLGVASSPLGLGVMFGAPALLCFGAAERPVRFGLGVAGILLAAGLHPGDQGEVLHAERSFFGRSRVLLDPSGRFHLFAHGGTLHGMQALDPAEQRTPLSYYHPSGPIGQVFAALGPTRRRIGVVGLGVGSLACLRSPGQDWTFFELDPAVERIARDPRLFTYLRDCGADAAVVLGDARLTLAAAPDGAFDLLVLDAYTSDAIPLHLLTREALDRYDRALAPGGALAFHVSNQFFDLRPALAAAARDRGWTALARDDDEVSAGEAARGKRPSRWVVLARARGDLGPLAADARWYGPPVGPDAPRWTDDRASALDALAR